ncbi:response regulator [Paenibacillus sp. GCM10027628]|uniref:response regulator n=1 Tax=Paenibacillus sp. GCM10027628 TaxID=3273413 RepID=UPI003630EC85
MNILIVDDEPIFIEKIKRIIADFSRESAIETNIVAEAYSGQEALRTIAKHMPDIVFTDIKMSGMNGIELSHILQKDWPDIAVVIISGYPSFDYAREAMRGGVVDYLLKPIDPELVKELLYRIQPQIRSKRYALGKKLIHSIIESDGQNCVQDPPDIQKTNVFSSYCVLAVQKLEALSDNDLLFLQQSENQHEKYMERLQQLMGDSSSIWIFNAKDGRSFIVVIGLHRIDESILDWIVTTTRDYFSFGGFPVSAAYSQELNNIADIKEVIPQLLKILYNRIVIGRSQMIRLPEEMNRPKQTYLLLANQFESKIGSILSKKDWPALKKEFFQLFQVWKTEQCPSIYVESNLKRIIHLIDRHLQTSDVLASKTLGNRIEEILFTAVSYEEAAGYCWEMVTKLLQLQSNEANHDNAVSLYERIGNYLKSHINEPVSLTQLSDTFNVSRTYLCNLFRNYADTSFVGYFTALRMDKAKELIQDHPDLILKDIAELVGFGDHHYFSRVFKTVTGQTPSEFKHARFKEE